VRESLFEAVPNVSEGRDAKVIQRLAAAGEGGGSVLLDAAGDPEHNRLVLSLAGDSAGISDAIQRLAESAVEAIDLRRHFGVHPRVGALDVVPLVPLGLTTPEAATALALEVATRIWEGLRIPVFLYGWASSAGTRLADVRAGRVRPDLGGPDLHPTAGAVCVGARPPLVAYNLLLPPTGFDTGREIARELRSNLGSRGVQALAFALRQGVQISTNVRDLEQALPAEVREEVTRLAAQRGLRIVSEEIVGLCPAAAAPAAAGGRILEGRLGEAGTRTVARALRAAGREDSRLAAERLERHEARLANLPTDQEEFLAAAELCLAAARMAAAVDLEHGLGPALLYSAARGLRQGLEAATISRHPARVQALNHSLDADTAERS